RLRAATRVLRPATRTTTTARPRAPGAAAVAVSFSEILKPSATAPLAAPRTAATTSGAAPRRRSAGRERSAIFMGSPPLPGLADRPFIASFMSLRWGLPHGGCLVSRQGEPYGA